MNEEKIIEYIKRTLYLINEADEKIEITNDLPDGKTYEFSTYQIYHDLKEDSFILFLIVHIQGSYWQPPDEDYIETLESKNLYLILKKVIEFNAENLIDCLGESFQNDYENELEKG